MTLYQKLRDTEEFKKNTFSTVLASVAGFFEATLSQQKTLIALDTIKN